MAKVVCVLYDDPVDGYPDGLRPRRRCPNLAAYPDGQTLPTPSAIDFTPGELLGSVSGELGLRELLEGCGHELVVTSDKDGPDSEFERHLADAEVVISQPFWPAYLTAERIAKAPNLQLAVTAGIGSDHVDLDAAIAHGVTVAEVTYCNSISVAEHVVMMILSLVRNYLPSHQWVLDGGWNIADCVARSYDVEGMHVGIGGRRSDRARRAAPAQAVRRAPALHRPASAPRATSSASSASPSTRPPRTWRRTATSSPSTPAAPRDAGLFDDELLGKMRRGRVPDQHRARPDRRPRRRRAGAWRAGSSPGYAGDVWYPQPAPADHPWRSMPHHGMTPHISGSSLSAQARYAAGTREILESWFAGTPDPRRVPDRRGRHARRRGSPLLQRPRLTVPQPCRHAAVMNDRSTSVFDSASGPSAMLAARSSITLWVSAPTPNR